MINPYIIILVLFIVTGLATTAWGWRIIARGRKTQHWPMVTGVIESSAVGSGGIDSDADVFGGDDLLPDIRYRYSVDGQVYQQRMTFSRDITPTKEYAEHFVNKYPAGSLAPIYYDPDQPEHSTLEPGTDRDDWLILAFGLAMTVVGMVLLIA